VFVRLPSPYDCTTLPARRTHHDDIAILQHLSSDIIHYTLLYSLSTLKPFFCTHCRRHPSQRATPPPLSPRTRPTDYHRPCHALVVDIASRPTTWPTVTIRLPRLLSDGTETDSTTSVGAHRLHPSLPEVASRRTIATPSSDLLLVPPCRIARTAVDHHHAMSKSASVSTETLSTKVDRDAGPTRNSLVR
jgi:hypothetical protein